MLGRLAGGLARLPLRQGLVEGVSTKRIGAVGKPVGRLAPVSWSAPAQKLSRRSYAGAPASLRQLSETFLNGTNAAYVEEMYEAWKVDPKTVHVSWAAFFKNLESGAAPGEGWVMPPTLGTSPHFMAQALAQSQVQQITSLAGGDKLLEDHLKVQLLIRAYQFRGHELADLDPLHLAKGLRPRELELTTYGFTEADLDREFFTYAAGLHSGLLSGKPRRTLREIISILDRAYCKTIGVEFMHGRSRERDNWIRQKFELDQVVEPTKPERLVILNRLLWATKFEQFLASKWNTTKRYASLTFRPALSPHTNTPCLWLERNAARHLTAAQSRLCIQEVLFFTQQYLRYDGI